MADYDELEDLNGPSVTVSGQAVFLSYASEDAKAAARICQALKAAGIEVWFDQGELRGGDAWDRKIRREIRNCLLFVPIISVNPKARTEGYFRLQWRLADHRTHQMGTSRPFLAPAGVDGTRDAIADVPDSFAAVQWTRLPRGEASPAFVERVTRLLSPDVGGPPVAANPVTSDAFASAGHSGSPLRPQFWRSRSRCCRLSILAPTTTTSTSVTGSLRKSWVP